MRLQGLGPLPLLAALALLPACGQLPRLVDVPRYVNGMASTPAAEGAIPSEELQLSTDDGADWVQLKSGEWLRGQVVRVRDGSLDFDSDELGDQSFDFEDLKRVITPHHQVLVTEDGRFFEGRLLVDETSIWIEGEKTVRIPRGEMLSILAVEGEGLSTWSGSISTGVAVRTGNTDQTDYSAVLKADRETGRTRWASRYSGAISQVSGTETANNHRIGSTFDVFLSKRFFVTLPGVDVYRDPFQNIDLRLTPYAAFGYEVVDTAAQTLSFSAGPAFQYERFDSALVAGEETTQSFAAVLASRYHWDITSDVEFEAKYNLTAPLPDVDEYNHNTVATLSVDLVGDLDLDLSVTWDRINAPQQGADGSFPQKDDFRMTVGLGWSF